MSTERTDHRFVFIGGLHRSGTWLQTHLLEKHPDVSRLGLVNKTDEPGDYSRLEGQFLQTVYPQDEHYGGVGRIGFHRDAHLTEGSSLVTEENRRRIFDEWARYWDLSRPVLLEKTPANILRTRFLQTMFPKSSFVLVLRHPAVVALAQQKWTGTAIMSLVEHWLCCYELLRDDLQRLDRYLIVRYEDFVADPESGWSRICRFLDLEPSQPEVSVRSDGNERYFRAWESALDADRERVTVPHRLIRRLMPAAIRYGYPITFLTEEARLCVTRFEQRASEFGYSLKDVRALGRINIEPSRQ